MKQINIIVTIITISLLIPIGMFAQAPTIGFGNMQGDNASAIGKPELSVSLTSSFTAFAPGYTTFGTTIMPQVTLPVSNKFRLSTGIGYSTLFMNADNGSVFSSSPSGYGHVFISGTYDVNEKISLRGTGYKTFNLSQSTPFNNDNNSSGYDFSSQGVIVDVEYRVTDNFRINVGFEYREQNTPMYNPNGFQQNNPHINTMSPIQGFNNNLVPF